MFFMGAEKISEIEKRAFRPAYLRELPWNDRLVSFLAVLTISTGVYQQIFEVQDKSAQLLEAHEFTPFGTFVELKAKVLEDSDEEDEKKDDEELSKEEKPEIKVIEDVSPYLNTGEDPHMPPIPALSEQQIADIQNLSGEIRDILKDDEKAEIVYQDYIMRLTEIVNSVSPENITKAYSEFLRRNKILEQYKNDIHRYVTEVRNTQGRYSPGLRSVLTILSGQDFNPDDPAGNCNARAENEVMHLLTLLPEEKIFLQFFDKMIKPDGTLLNVGHIRVVYEQSGRYFTTEGPSEINVNEKGVFIVPLREALMEFAGVRNAVPAFYEPYLAGTSEFQKDESLNPEKVSRSILSVDLSGRSLKPAFGTVDEQEFQPPKIEYTGLKIAEENSQKRKGSFDTLENSLKEGAVPVPPELAIDDASISREVLNELLDQYLIATDKAERSEILVEIMVRYNLYSIRERIVTSGFGRNNFQSLYLGAIDSYELFNDTEFIKQFETSRSRRVQLDGEEFKALLNDPRMIRAMEFARENKIEVSIDLPQIDKENEAKVLNRLSGLNVSEVFVSSPSLEAVESTDFSSLVKKLKWFHVYDPPEGFKKESFKEQRVLLWFDYPSPLPLAAPVKIDQMPNENVSSYDLRYYDLDKDEVVPLESVDDLLNMQYEHFVQKVYERQSVPHSDPMTLAFTEAENDDVYYVGAGGKILSRMGTEMVMGNLDKFSNVLFASFLERFEEKIDREKLEILLRFLFEVFDNDNKSLSSRNISLSLKKIDPFSLEEIGAFSALRPVDVVRKFDDGDNPVKELVVNFDMEKGNAQLQIDDILNMAENYFDRYKAENLEFYFGLFYYNNRINLRLSFQEKQ